MSVPLPSSSPVRTVAVVDIGSNSIKVLVARRTGNGGIESLAMRTIDARISAGISRQSPRLSEEGITRGVEAVRALLNDAAKFSPERIAMVATSAVRDAENGGEFRARVRAATGHEIRILTGDEEANLIGRGLTCDPALRGLRDFYVFDLGGGSLECLAFRDRRIEQAVSLQLGCVRLTEKFVRDASQPFAAAEGERIVEHTREIIARSGFAFSLPAGAVAIGTGGSVTTLRAILGAREGKAFDDTDAVVPIGDLRDALTWIASLPLAQRKEISGLPAARADVFPVALATLLAVAELGGFAAYHNSVYNLRYGLADEALNPAG
jgi:exopolyphosphatase/guanosine-5'-triphosphate,3'-diphosphate pyrophosphatase